MHLSRLNFDRRHPSVRQALRNCHDMHRNLMSAFPDSMTRAQVGLLYQLEGDSIWLSSHTPPTFISLEQKGFSVAGTRSIDALQKVLHVGMCLGFHLLAVPSKKTHGDGKHSQRRYLCTQEERFSWLRRKSEQGGFSLHTAQEYGEEIIYGQRQGHPLVFTAMHWEGILEVTDLPLFWKSLCDGIGAERAYGAGLLRIYRL